MSLPAHDPANRRPPVPPTVPVECRHGCEPRADGCVHNWNPAPMGPQVGSVRARVKSATRRMQKLLGQQYDEMRPPIYNRDLGDESEAA